MPNLDFYAVESDQQDVLEAVFNLGLFRVFEAFSEPDAHLREFTSADQIPQDPHGLYLMLFAVGSGPEPVAERIDLREGALGDATFRYQCKGWGVIQLYFGCLFGDSELRLSHTNHNTEARARKWSETLADLGDPSEWDWPAVTKSSRRLNRMIRSMAVDQFGPHPVLAQASVLIGNLDLKHEYGTGIHAEPSPGMNAATSQAP